MEISPRRRDMPAYGLCARPARANISSHAADAGARGHGHARGSRGYDAMDHSEPNRAFVERLVELGAFGRVLDIGTGPGHIPLSLSRAPAGHRVLGIDLSTHMLRLAEATAPPRRTARASPSAWPTPRASTSPDATSTRSSRTRSCTTSPTRGRCWRRRGACSAGRRAPDPRPLPARDAGARARARRPARRPRAPPRASSSAPACTPRSRRTSSAPRPTRRLSGASSCWTATATCPCSAPRGPSAG